MSTSNNAILGYIAGLLGLGIVLSGALFLPAKSQLDFSLKVFCIITILAIIVFVIINFFVRNEKIIIQQES